MPSGRTGLWVRWSARQLRRRWPLVATVAVIIALGTGTYAGLGGTSEWRLRSQDESYAALAMHDALASLPEGTTVAAGTLATAARSGAHPEWIQAVEERLVLPVEIDASTATKTILVPGRIVGMSPTARLDTLYLEGGTGLSAGRDAVVLESKFAKAHHLAPAGQVSLGGGRTVRYDGIGYSPEYFRFSGVSASSSFATEENFAVLFAPIDVARELTGQAGMVNDVAVQFAPGVDRAAATAELTAAMAERGATVVRKEDDLVYRALYEDARNDQQTWDALALLILGGAVFAGFNLISRMVESERREIGVGMAQGAPPALLATRHLLVAAEIAAIGALAGVAVGLLAGAGMRSLLESIMPLPIWDTPFPTGRYLQAAALGAAVPFAAAAIPVWRAVRVEPVDALRTGPKASRGRGAGLASLLTRLHGNTIRLMPFRNLARAFRRTMLTAVGIAAAMTALVAVFGLVDTMFFSIDRIDHELSHDSPDRVVVSLDGVSPVTGPAVRAVSEAAPVGRAEPALRGPGSISTAAGKVDVIVQTVDMASGIWTPTVSRGHLPMGGDGIVISEKAAADLRIEPGDTVSFRHPVLGAGGMRLVDDSITVAGIEPNPLRVFVYVDRSQAARFGLTGLANIVTVEPRPGASVAAVERAVFGIDGVAAADPVATLARTVRDRLSQLTGVLRLLEVIVLGLATLIAFNSASIGHDERAREQATMFAFGVRVRTVLGIATIESVITGVVGTVLGLGGGLLMVRWITERTVAKTLPDLGMAPHLSTGTLLTTVVLGVLVVAIAPLFTVRRLRDMDVPATLRVLE